MHGNHYITGGSLILFKKDERQLMGRQTHFSGLLVCEDLWVDPVELQDEFVH